MISHSQRGGRQAVRTGCVATTRTNAKRLETSVTGRGRPARGRLPRFRRQPLRERAHRLRSAVGPSHAAPPADAAVARGYREGLRACRYETEFVDAIRDARVRGRREPPSLAY